MAVERLNKGVEVPPRQRGSGFWLNELNTEWKRNPNVTYEYGGTSSSTSSNLRRDYGVDAETRTIKNEETGESRVHLYVTYRPEKVDEIKGEYMDGGSKRKGSKDKAPEAPAPAPAKAGTKV